MASQKHYLTQTLPLTNLARRVSLYAEQCCPDIAYKESGQQGLTFTEVDLVELSAKAVKAVGLSITDPDTETATHLFTRWSRMQLLSLMGTKEKWFDSVSCGVQAEELNTRRHVLQNTRIKTMKTFDEDSSLRIVRGIVSSSYADIPDDTIMQALTSLMPEGLVLKHYSGKTDRALYAYIFTDNELRIPNTEFIGRPGVVVKNSEVGYSSLQVIPMLYSVDAASPAVLGKKMCLRRVHRGDVKELEKDFQSALETVRSLWGPLQSKLEKLSSITYTTEDEAVGTLISLLNRERAQRWFIHRCEQAYRAAHHKVHDASKVFEAILRPVTEEKNKDDAHLHSMLAGAVLLTLITL